jgi:PIN domain nuclease of toxin-antitoxin system
MKFLIDTHTFLWFIAGSHELSKTAKKLIENDNNHIFISIASLWEIFANQFCSHSHAKKTSISSQRTV